MYNTFRTVPKFVRHTPYTSTYSFHSSAFSFARHASSTTPDANAEESESVAIEYPFPKNAHPTPYEIFHLKPGARPSEIKARYYQLVRLHHPDAPHARRLPTHISHSRFQAIQAAHDVLTGKIRRSDTLSSSAHGYSHYTGPRGHTSHKHRRGHHQYAEWAEAADDAEHADDKRGDQMVILGTMVAIGLLVVPFFFSTAISDARHQTAVQNLAQARREAREFGMERRRQIRKRVRSQELEREYEERSLTNGNSEAPGSTNVDLV